MKTISLMTFLVFNCVFTNAQNCFWVKGTGGSQADEGESIAMDSSGNVYATGYFSSSSVTFGSTVLTKFTNSNSSAFVVKYNSMGNVIWAKGFGDRVETRGNGITTDANNNVYITGLFRADSITLGTITLHNLYLGSSEVFLAKLDSNGNVIWAKASLGANQDDIGNGLTVDFARNVYVTGTFGSDSIQFGGVLLYNKDTVLSDPTKYNVFVVKYDSSGTAVWGKNAGGKYFSHGNAITTDVSGNVYVTGGFACDTIHFDTIPLVRGDGSTCFFIALYDSNGNVQWAKKAISSQPNEGWGVATDGNNTYVTGKFIDDSIAFGNTTLSNFQVGWGDLFIVKYDSGGHVIWAKKAGGNKDDMASGLAVDFNGGVYLTGYFQSSTITFGSTTLLNSFPSSYNPDLFVAKYDTSGTPLWAYNATGGNAGKSIVVGGVDNIYVTGRYTSMTLGNATPSNGGQNDIFVAHSYSFSSSVSATNVICNGGGNGSVSVTLTGGISPFTYSWNNGDTTSIAMNLVAGNYSVTVSDVNGCVQRDSVTISEPPADVASLCLVTVDSLSQNNIIVWDKTPFTTVDSFIVYREIATNNYQPIASIPFDSLSQFIDTVRTLYFPNTGNPNAGTFRYKIQAHDTCGNYSALSPYHNTIYFINNNGTFSWPQLYTIENGSNPVSSYVLMRDDNSNGNWHAVSSVAGTQQTVSDPQYSLYQNTASWRIETQWSIACTPTYRLLSNSGVLSSTYSSSLSNIYRYSVNAVNEYSLDNSVKSYPNPTDGKLTIHSSILRIQNIEIQNIIGEVLRFTSNDSQQNTIQIDLSGFPQGIYFLHVKTPNGVVVRKIVKE